MQSGPRGSEAEAQGRTEARKVYRGASLRQIAMPMGGLGAGNVALGGGGSLRNWQIFNQCNPNAQLQASFFAIWAKPEGGEAVARLLQTEPVGKLPTLEAVEFVGEYPFAWLTYQDRALPVQARLEACCPLIPLNAKDSGIPGVVFRFTVKNPGAESVAVSLAQTCQNAVGFDGFNSFEEADGNLNRTSRRGGLHVLNLTTKEKATGAAFAKPVVLLTESRQIARSARFFGNADLRYFDSLANAADALKSSDEAVIAPALSPTPHAPRLTPHAPVVAIVDDVDPAKSLPLLEKFVAEGGALVITGGGRGLLDALLPESVDHSAIAYEDFEAEKYDPAKWTAEGYAFGDGPARGTWPGQQPVSGFQGGGLINSFRGGDPAMGRLTSKPFQIERAYIHFLIGGGNHPGETCINLRIGGKVVRTATGRNEEKLHPERWNVREFIGQEGVLEIVDTRQDAWGHINIDEIYFSDRATPRLVLTPEAQERVRAFLPPTLNPEGQEETVAWAHGKGRVLLMRKPWDDRFTAGPTAHQERLAFLGQQIAEAAGTTFTPANGLASTHPYFGSMALATDAEDASHKAQWDALEAFWNDFAADGRLEATPSVPAPPGKTWNGALAAHLTLAPGEEKTVTFLLGWHFPNRYRDRVYDVGFGKLVPEYEVKYRLGNRYNTWFKNAGEVVAYLHRNGARLLRETRLYHDALFDSTLPYVVRDAVSSQVSTLRSQTSMWLEDGRWMAYEGLGCCPMNCTHVYNYAQTLAKLFPELERDVRRTDLTAQLKEDGGVRHRTQLPLEAPRASEPFTDGHLSTITKAYREHLQSADGAFLAEFWPAIKKAMEFAIREYDPNGDGLVEGRQPNTYDCDVYGHNSFITTQFLVALRAAEEMAKEQGEAETARRYRALFEQGSRNLDATCWNGDYYQQVFADYLTTPTQYGPGCLSDQVLGQWWAHLLDLGYLLPPERVQAALRAVLKHNFITDFTHFDNHGQRVFADGGDQGLVCCTWPRGGRPEKVPPILYCDEVWTGIEYQVAGHLMYEGMTDEALKLIAALRARYDGVKRNPWNEIECGDHYGRAMASWSALLAASGYRYHGPKGILGFAPRLHPDDFRAFFSTAQGWGRFSQKRAARSQENMLHLAYGAARLNQLHLALPDAAKGANVTATASIGRRRVPGNVTVPPDSLTAQLAFAAPLTLKAGQTLRITLGWG
jgi:uncharacterized protein (DUF608 family)